MNPTDSGHINNPSPPAITPLNDALSPGNHDNRNGPTTAPLSHPIHRVITVGGASLKRCSTEKNAPRNPDTPTMIAKTGIITFPLTIMHRKTRAHRSSK